MQGIQRICADCGQFLAKYVAATAVLILISGCQQAAETTAEPSLDGATAALPAAAPPAQCGEQGYLSTELFGALAGKIEWLATDFECEGMPRPDGDGARLRFAGQASDDLKIAFIIALPQLRHGETGNEYESKVTVIEEGVGRFYTTGDNDICWTDILEFENLGDSESEFLVGGNLYCVAPLAEINGDSDITIQDLKFRGLLNWEAL